MTQLDPPPSTSPRALPSARLQSAATILLMLIAVLAVYLPWQVWTGEQALYGMDYDQLHLRRLEFARDNLLGPQHTLPDWYPRELMGTPFRANLQSFPWIPLRLVLLAFPPWRAYAIGVALSASFAALFTFLLGRELGLGRLPSAVAGWTFACNGFVASRVLLGHLPILETVWVLPALLWLSLGALRADRRWPWLAGLASTAFCCAVAGHPQLGFYALVTTAAFLLSTRSRRAIAAAGAIAGGIVCSAFAVIPMAALILRSTRVLKLAPPDNDIPMLYSRLLAFFAPWKDGWPPQVQRFPPQPLTDAFPTFASFWDTVVYAGLIPWLAVAALIAVAIWRRRKPSQTVMFLAIASVVALVTALPDVAKLWSLIPGTALRSAARQVYVTELGLALALAGALQLLLHAEALFTPGFRRGVVGILVLAHAFDLGDHARAFVSLRPPAGTALPNIARVTSQVSPEERVALDFTIETPSNRRRDDLGYFDSLALARTYAWLLAVAGKPADLNEEALMGSQLPRRALESGSVRIVASRGPHRSDLPQLGREHGYNAYQVPNPVPRAMFFPWAHVQVEPDEAAVLKRMRDPAVDLHDSVTLVEAPAHDAATPEGKAPLVVPFARPTSDTIALTARAPSSGVLRILESRDLGWSAEVDGHPAPLLLADGFAMGIALPPGEHRIQLTYRTPYATTAAVLSVIGLLLLVAGLWWEDRLSRGPVVAGGPHRG